MRTVLVFFYFIVVPYCQAPAWCLQVYKDRGERNFGLFDCDAVSLEQRIKYSNFPSFSPLLSVIIDLICLVSFQVMVCYDNKWRNQSKGEKRRTAILVIASIVSLIDLIRSFYALKYPYFANLMRVIVLLTFSHGLRQRVYSLFGDLRDSFAILLTIFSYIFIFVLTVYYFYRPMFEGIMSFGTIKDTYKNMTILFTTANFPDIFLPAMNVGFFNCLLFMFFMLVGLYFLTNLLLANVFNKYMNRLAEKRRKRVEKRMGYITIIFKQHDRNANGVLEHMEAKAFLADVFDFDYHNEVHRNTAKKILEIIDVEDNQLYRLERFLQFFRRTDFIEIADLEHINSLNAVAMTNGARAPDYEEHYPVEARERHGFFDGWAQVVLICLNVLITCFFILNDQFREVKAIRSGFWKLLSVPFTAIFAVECAYIIFANDIGTIIREKKLYILELFCLIFAVIGYIKMFSDGSNDDFVTGASYVLFSFLVRNLRISYLLSEVKAFKVIMDMIMKMTIPIMYMLACLYIVYYVFAIVGMFGLSGEIKVPRFHGEDGIPNNLYYLVNFNDLGSSMVTLYAFMIINNWPAITDTLVNAAGGDVWPRIYFMVFYIIVQWIILNLVIAMMLEIYTNVESENDIE